MLTFFFQSKVTWILTFAVKTKIFKSNKLFTGRDVMLSTYTLQTLVMSSIKKKMNLYLGCQILPGAICNVYLKNWKILHMRESNMTFFLSPSPNQSNYNGYQNNMRETIVLNTQVTNHKETSQTTIAYRVNKRQERLQTACSMKD